MTWIKPPPAAAGTMEGEPTEDAMRGFGEWAAFGPIGRAGARRCIECRAARPAWEKCDGFGPACFLPRAEEPPREGEDKVTFSSSRRPPGAR
ncbi:MAG TPA: hypothetical protein VFU92_07345 [Usitatibacter sp.]|jgi:hypothetical protein|nr:hypothetical protein [Usitatibacter sp.]